MANQPVYKVKIGSTTATIWDNDGSYSVEIKRSYRDVDADWKETFSFYHKDLLNVAKCAERAEIWIARQSHERQKRERPGFPPGPKTNAAPPEAQ
ncbi:hypothetical protein [Limimaricola sp.]|uniref:hypothetical protein n=1 Tax=Limimaricola sp. TaxID=2211665 RepID=UPI0025C6F9A6|nr:hypothetical protein [Limimaricola sp.]